LSLDFNGPFASQGLERPYPQILIGVLLTWSPSLSRVSEPKFLNFSRKTEASGSYVRRVPRGCPLFIHTQTTSAPQSRLSEFEVELEYFSPLLSTSSEAKRVDLLIFYLVALQSLFTIKMPGAVSCSSCREQSSLPFVGVCLPREKNTQGGTRGPRTRPAKSCFIPEENVVSFFNVLPPCQLAP